MKKLFFTLIAGLGLVTVSNAQTTDKGTFMLGGNVSYQYSKVDGVKGEKQGYAILPQAGYFIQDNFALGLGLGYAGSTDKNDAGSKIVSGEFSVAPFARLYKGDGALKFFGQLSVPMGWGTNKVGGSKTGTTERYGVAVSPGIAYFPTSKIGIELAVRGLYYEHNSVKPKTGGKIGTNEFGLNANSFAPTIGVNFYF